MLVIPDGAADTYRERGRSPLAIAQTSTIDRLAREGVSGLLQTLYEELPKESLVAQLGMLGWDPRIFYPCGRASCELLALEGIELRDDDLAFRANLVQMEGRTLVSYNAKYIHSDHAIALIDQLNRALRQEFPDFELYHNSDFRNTLVVRDAGIDPRLLRCPEPHENQGVEFDIARLISGSDPASARVAARVNRYLERVAHLLARETANMLFPWSASKAFKVPSFSQHTGFSGRVGVVGCMDFLQGIAKAGKMDFFKVGNGRPNTDYPAKGDAVIDLLSAGYEFVVCHINAPDEAAHMRDLQLKIRSIELIDEHVVRPVVQYFEHNPGELGGVMVAPDHYTNYFGDPSPLERRDVHSLHPVPFALWNGRDRDGVRSFSEDDAVEGKYGRQILNHMELMAVLGVQALPAGIEARAEQFAADG